MQTLVARLFSQINNTGTIFYETPGGEISPELEKIHRSQTDKSYINEKVTIKTDSKNTNKMSYCKKENYLNTAKRPIKCKINCATCLECSEPDCTYRGMY